MLGRLFGDKTFLDAEIEAWHLESWVWLLDKFTAELPFKTTPLVLPTADFFPPSDATGNARALHVFECVRTAMQMQDWPCELEMQPQRRTGRRVAEFVTIDGEQDPNGTFRVEPDGRVVISFAPELLDRPSDLVATLAHELAHYLLMGHVDHDDATHELMTDLTVAYTGFGLFGANSAFSFKQHGDAFGQGWESRRSGYLSPRSWAFALAVFTEVTNTRTDVSKWLSGEVASQWKSAVKYLRKKPEALGPLLERA